MLRTMQDLISEFASLRHTIPTLSRRVAGRRFIEGKRHESNELRLLAPEYWVHNAHKGTLEKLEGLLNEDRPYGTFELLAIARNVFENQVWVRLLGKDASYGLVFYAHLLRDQRKHTQGMIDKLRAEVSLFRTAEDMNLEVMDALGDEIAQTSDADHSAQEIGQRYRDQESHLDDMVRTDFCLYGDLARLRGYGTQADELESELIPEHALRLSEINQYESNLSATLPSLLNPTFLTLATRDWQWKARADEAALTKEYEFLYRFTSRLLHSTPLNIITDKTLADSESIVVLDYIVLATTDILKLIDEFLYPGMADVKLFELDS